MTVAGYLTRWLFLGLCLVVLSCSSDGGGTGGTGSPVVASGRATAVDDLVVTGIPFDTSDATILVNGQPGTEADLQVGQVLTVEGTLDPSGGIARAETVRFDRNVAGPIESIDSMNFETNILVVLGQIVEVDAGTQFGATTFDELVVGDIVEVSGFVDANGALRATRVDVLDVPGFEIEVEGTITNLDAANETFTLNTLQVDFSAAALIDLPGNQLANGQFVEVTSTQNVVNGELVADRVKGKDAGIAGEAGQRVEFQGLITKVTSADTFEVDGQAVRITNDTVFEGGTAADIVLNAGVEVEGRFDTEGIVIAEEVEFGGGGEIELEGVVTSVDSMTRTFVIGEQTVLITGDTVTDEDTVVDINDISVDDQLQIEGFFREDGVFEALAIEFFVDIEGVITSVTSANTFVVDGHVVLITAETEYEGGDEDDIQVDVLVEVEGLFDENGVLVAMAIEFLE